MENKYIKRLKWNIIQIIIGIIFLFLVYLWVGKYPSEWNAFKIQFSVLWDQVKILYYSIFTNVGKDVKERQQIERAYKSLLDVVVDSNCLTGKSLQELQHFYDKLKTMSLSQYLENKENIKSNLYFKYQYIKNKCPEIKFYR